jgi:proline iminopeptidase
MNTTSASFTTSDSSVLHYKIEGVGTPVLFLSGGPGFSGDYMSSIADAVATTRQCIVLDQRGTGRSHIADLNSSTISLEIFIDDIEALRKSINKPSFILVGHSWGAMLAIAYAERYSSRVEALVLISPGPMTAETLQSAGKSIEDAIMRGLSAEEKEELATWNTAERVSADAERAAVERNKLVIPAFVADRKHIQAITDVITVETYNEQVGQLISEDLMRINLNLAAGLTDLSKPVLLIQGREDPMGDGTAREMQRQLPNARLELFDDCGHFPWIEQPERFYAALSHFLQQFS